MNRSIVGGMLALLMAAIIIGCGGQEDAVMKEHLKFLEELTKKYESVTDKQSFQTAQTDIKALMEKNAEVDKKMAALDPVIREKTFERFKPQIDPIMERLAVAKRKAADLGK